MQSWSSGAQKFYETHEDAYDYLAIYNAMGIEAATGGVLAYETTVRSAATGYGVTPVDYGPQYGSASRLRNNNAEGSPIKLQSRTRHCAITRVPTRRPGRPRSSARPMTLEFSSIK